MTLHVVRSIRLRAAVSLAAALAALVPAGPAQAAGYGPVPSVNGYTITARQDLTDRLVYVQYRSSNPRRVINVAFLRKGGPERLRTVVSGNRVAGPKPWTETVSSMCKRVRCRIAVNADFFSNATGQPAGGMATEGYPIRTPPDVRYHFFADASGNVGVKQIRMPISFKATYPNGQRPYVVHSLNTPRNAERAAVYSPVWGSTTEQSGGFEIGLKLLNPPIAMDKKLNVRIERGSSAGNMWIPSDGLVVSGHGGHATALSALWRDVQAGIVPREAELTFDSVPDLRTYTGGTPPLLQSSAQAFREDGSSFIRTSDPKTMVGRRSNGDAILAVVDGRQSGWSVGFTMSQAMQFMRSLGATDALNLDGGGSSTFVKYGSVMNRPSDGRERPIAASLLIVG